MKEENRERLGASQKQLRLVAEDTENEEFSDICYALETLIGALEDL